MQDQTGAEAREAGRRINDAATKFLLHGIQEWGQTDEKRIAVTQALLDAAGFKATATCGPVFGGIWPKPCEGEDAEAASAWLNSLTKRLRRGKFEEEVSQIESALKERAGA